MSTWKARLTKRLKPPSRSMHPFPCSALLACFGKTRDSASFNQSSVADTHSTIRVQPVAKPGRQPSHPSAEEGAPEKRRDSSTRAEGNGSANRNSSHRTAVQPAETPEDVPGSLDDGADCEAVVFQASIPRPSIIDTPKEEEFQEEPKCLELEQKMTSGGPPEDIDPKDSYLITRSIMAEPDYIEDDNPELIRPQKLINPVKTSRNHQDLHRELLMNQKRGLAPQNKPELQKVMEKRKRDQVIKQKEEEAQKKKSDLEIELLKRQQKLEQLELEKQKLQEEQENAPEFVKVKGNLRRTGQEVAQAQES
ncbi:PREDICTED: protein FAM107B isoform X1 [Colobus angolensis palliatus]|uniref:Family with sequence similarity 107 member B n=1 Tax=Colobus angolensis palliatus TaxID=336983 RepID=A0A2K5KFB1_COLAP|nr:PREDICTED: protein FAM107B isoform X1 [Colobus angolensis palliatus]